MQDYTLFRLASDIGDNPDGVGTAHERSQIEAEVTPNRAIQAWSDLLFRDHRPYARYHTLRTLNLLFMQKQLQLDSGDMLTFVEYFRRERNQWISNAFGICLLTLERTETLIEVARTESNEVARYIAVLNLDQHLKNSFNSGQGTQSGYRHDLQKALQEIALSDASNVVRNAVVQHVLSFEYRYPHDHVEFCRQWYYAASAALGMNADLGKDKPRSSGYFGSGRGSVLAPIAPSIPAILSPAAERASIANAGPAVSPAAISPKTDRPTLTHTTEEKTHKFIKKQQGLAVAGIVAGVALSIFGPPELLKAGLVFAGICVVWRFAVVPWLKWWHHG